jgi:hypothetical protein
MLAALMVPAAPQAVEERGQEFSDFLGISGSDLNQLRGWIVQPWIALQPKPSSFPNEQLKIRYTFNSLRAVALGQRLPHVQDNGETGLEDLPAFIPLLEPALRTQT